MRHGHRDGHRRVGPKAMLVLGPIQIDQNLVDSLLVGHITALERARDLCHRGNRSVDPIAPKASPPSLLSTASALPMDAPAGAMARAMAPPSKWTSTSTVGRPRESQTRRPLMFPIRVFTRAARTAIPPAHPSVGAAERAVDVARSGARGPDRALCQRIPRGICHLRARAASPARDSPHVPRRRRVPPIRHPPDRPDTSPETGKKIGLCLGDP